MTWAARDSTRTRPQSGTMRQQLADVFAPWPHFGPDEIEVVTEVLRSGNVNYWTGNHARLFEQEFAQAVGRRYGIALANGTVALELALHAFDIRPGDEVITSSRTFIASASAVVMRGAVPVVADVDRESQNVTVETLEACLTDRTRAIVVVHLAGWPCDMDAVMGFAAAHDLLVIEDCAQATGATYRGRPVGSFGHAAAFSFCQDKIITTGGEGGMLVLDDPEAWKRAWSFKDHGKSYDAVFLQDHPVGFRWLHESFGTNYRLTEAQAAIGRLQLKKLDDWIAVRNAHASVLSERFAGAPGLRVTLPPDHVQHGYYKYYAFVEPEQLRPGWDRDRIMETVAATGVPCFSGSCSEIYLERAFQDSGLGPPRRHPVARELGETSLAFLVHPTLSLEAIELTSDVVAEVMHEATL
jgi:dTDP-4-amino-4,6-dideoxygalactose transaminase